MCGLVAYYSRVQGRSLEPRRLEAMLSTLRLRGPDGQTTFHRDGVSLGHARLSIIDLEGGTQPIFNEDSSVACVLNGEIYNHGAIRKELEPLGHKFRTRSDTESLVHLYEEFGARGVERTVGMFAYVIADFGRKELLVYRDRLGEKPLYYVDHPEFFACASEIKALRHLPGLDLEIDRKAIAQYLRLGCIASPLTVFRGIRKLEPGSFLHVSADGVKKIRYWSARPDRDDRPFNERQCIEELSGLLAQTIPQKLIADVPTGVLLSGGLDSSAVVAFAQPACDTPLRTFSVGFGSSINELPLARQVSERYGTNHTELVVGLDLLPDLHRVAAYFDEPFADSSALPTLAVARAAREHVKVVLAGDGGDELFAGYSAYLGQRRYSDNPLLRKGLSVYDRLLASRSITRFDILPKIYSLMGGAGSRASWLSIRADFTVDSVASLAGAGDLTDIDPRAESGWPDDPLSQAFEFDINCYLPDDLLKKVDMMTMLCSLEARAPFLDHRLVEFALRIPPIEKVRGRTTKALLRKLLDSRLPAQITNGPKQGFGAPLADWLEGPLRDFALDSLGPRARVRSILDGEQLDRILAQSWKDLRSDWRAPGRIWMPLMLEMWAANTADWGNTQTGSAP